GRAREETTEGGGDSVAARSRESGGVKTWDKNKGPRRVRYFPESDFRQETRTSGARRRPQRGRPAPSSQGGRTAAPTAAEKLPDRVDVFHPVTVKDLS